MAGAKLFVVLGAGASRDAATDFRLGELIPPLVADLFDRRFDGVLDQYPFAKNAAPEIRDAIDAASGAPALSLEDFLRTRYRDSSDELDRRRYYSVALYLQHVLWQVSRDETSHFDNLDRLINQLLRSFESVCFITLNYDLLLDRCLNALTPLTTLDAFIQNPRWSLIKLHGSISWGREILSPAGLDLYSPPADLEQRLSDTIYHRWSLDLGQLRVMSDADRTFNVFPALSVPIGSEDQITCPTRHEEFLDNELRAAEEVDLLVIGYSAFDPAVVKKLWPARGKVRSMKVVNRGRDEAVQVALRLVPDLALNINDPRVSVSDSTFGQWSREELPAWCAARADT